MHVPPTKPIGLQVIDAAQVVGSALDAALTAAGGSLGTWLILVAASGKDRRHGDDSQLPEAMRVDTATLSDDVRRMEGEGLVVRKPDIQGGRVPGVELTEAGRASFHRLLRVVVAFDTRLRARLTGAEIDSFSSTLERLRGNISDDESP
jgi:MarR family transcriptional regulator, transcriptional regulator for hemolysin